MSRPLVSVVIPFYNNNNEKVLRACFDSVIHQTYSNIQFIVIDDGSANGASELLQRLQPEYGFIMEKQINKGISGALNTGIKKYATGKYVAILAHDDFWALNKLEKQVAFMEAAPQSVAASCTRGYYFYENENAPSEARMTSLLQKKNLTFDSLLIHNCILAPSAMYRRNLFDEIGYFDEASVIEDWDMWLRISDKYEIGFIEEPLVYYRRHAENLSKNFAKYYASMLYLAGKWKNKKGYAATRKTIVLRGINNLARHQKLKTLHIAASNFQYCTHWLYWRGIFKIFIPGFFYKK